MDYVVTRSDDYLAHYGISGQKHGIRRYQNEDGSLTAEGKERYGSQTAWENKQMYKRGTITKQEYKDRKHQLADGKQVSGYDKWIGGRNRGSREFQRRHEKGYKVASSVINGAAGALAAGAFVNRKGSVGNGKTAVAMLLGGAAGAGIGYGSQAVSNKFNRNRLASGYGDEYSRKASKRQY